jgi:hypothetical protein
LSSSGLAFAPAFGGDSDLVADLRGSLARDVPLAFGLMSSAPIMMGAPAGALRAPLSVFCPQGRVRRDRSERTLRRREPRPGVPDRAARRTFA